MTCGPAPLTRNSAPGCAGETFIEDNKDRLACVSAVNQARKHPIAVIFLVALGLLAVEGVLVLSYLNSFISLPIL